MSGVSTPFDAAKVASLAAECKTLLLELDVARISARDASKAVDRLEMTLRNKQTELTRAVATQLDPSITKDLR